MNCTQFLAAQWTDSVNTTLSLLKHVAFLGLVIYAADAAHWLDTLSTVVRVVVLLAKQPLFYLKLAQV